MPKKPAQADFDMASLADLDGDDDDDAPTESDISGILEELGVATSGQQPKQKSDDDTLLAALLSGKPKTASSAATIMSESIEISNPAPTA